MWRVYYDRRRTSDACFAGTVTSHETYHHARLHARTLARIPTGESDPLIDAYLSIISPAGRYAATWSTADPLWLYSITTTKTTAACAWRGYLAKERAIIKASSSDTTTDPLPPLSLDYDAVCG